MSLLQRLGVGRATAGVPAGRLQRWEAATEWPLAGVAVIFLAVYSVQVLAQTTGALHRALSLTDAVLYLAFVVDYVVRLWLAPNRGRWFVRHLLDLAIVVLPMLRPLRLLRLIVLLKVMQRAVGRAIRGRVVIYTACSVTMLIYVASLAVLDAERGEPTSDINSFGDALWWAIATVTTVGYGDYAPATPTGRVIAAFLMLGGISLLGVVTATLASWIVQRVAEEDTANQAATAAQIEDLRAEIRRLADAVSDPDARSDTPAFQGSRLR
ncbi:MULTISPECIES: potassium channel family protein [Mycobacterium]|uniref:Ion transporter n=1 Tax=Mycobacterium syngnathidarum TaxID=1908205 RepID=A0A1S1K2D1_9MYCO|nr:MULTISPECIES: potassium channel family protein [Mycobacterium]MCG7610587.1 potassium channel family protein [Mycobacterium sp. CnD-18-1]OHT97761.1 ion transporter [Mycobacterium syngnathidarum]OLT96192.1 ion transporter [Mycobacterium syngnathidarum]